MMLGRTLVIAIIFVSIQTSAVSGQTIQPTSYPFYCLFYGGNLWLRHGDEVFEPTSISRERGDDFVEATDGLTGEVRAAEVPRYLWESSAEEWLAQCRSDAVRFKAAPKIGAGIEGNFFPAGEQDWSCRSDHVGLDGGALAILDNVQYGADATCRLEDPQPNGAGTTFNKVCTGEGMEWRETMTLTPTSAGIALSDEHGVFHWWRCGN